MRNDAPKTFPLYLLVRLSVCVRNERDNAVARVANKLTKEGDLFLGEKIVEVQKVGMSQDVWYKLGKWWMASLGQIDWLVRSHNFLFFFSQLDSQRSVQKKDLKCLVI